MQKDSYLPVITDGAGNYLFVKRGTTRFFENCFLSFIKKFPKKRRGSSWPLPLPYVSYLLLRTLSPPYVHYVEIRGVLCQLTFVYSCSFVNVRDWICFGERKIKIVISYLLFVSASASSSVGTMTTATTASWPCSRGIGV